MLKEFSRMEMKVGSGVGGGVSGTERRDGWDILLEVGVLGEGESFFGVVCRGRDGV